MGAVQDIKWWAQGLNADRIRIDIALASRRILGSIF